MRIDELFDSTYPWQWTQQDETKYKAQFRNDEGHMVKVDMVNNHGSNWNIGFSRNYDVETNDEGDQFKIFSTVIDVIKDFMEKVKPDTITFEAFEDDGKTSRVRLYNTMTNKMAASSGYISKIIPTSNGAIFKLTRMYNE